MSDFQMGLGLDVIVKDLRFDDFGKTTNNLKHKMKKDIRLGISVKKNIYNQPLPRNEMSVAIAKGRNQWMFNTGRWWRDGIKVKSTKTEAIIFMSEAAHTVIKSGKNEGEKITYKFIGMLHNGKYAEYKGAPRESKDGGEFWGISVRIIDFMGTVEFNRWLSFDMQRMIAKAPWTKI